MKPRYDEVVVFSPSAVTGGPEALHQLSHAINELGGSSRIAYYAGDDCRCTASIDSITCTKASTRCLESYAIYDPKPLTTHRITNSTFLVMPEILTLFVERRSKRNSALWWLSVDHAKKNNEHLRYANYRHEFFSKNELNHFYQSDYARSYIVENGATTIAPLYDYVDRSFFTPPAIEKHHIALFPAKGEALASLFCSQQTSSGNKNAASNRAQSSAKSSPMATPVRLENAPIWAGRVTFFQ